ncbi:MAG: UTP--glucose-1-phosphate uridylyltransferase [Pseudonocardiales bacterium]|nr:UTP--glucose-1-phosphate uridylyltransferase [Pseudonocardiales bacterium]MBW0009549.1 UTP--glucose-1-phosphate uridylyltransferase [Pseudonocardiales bacterium]
MSASDCGTGGYRGFRTAVVPAAGLGTRFLPTTKTVPKELLPVLDTPAIEYVAAEAARAGADRLVLVVSPGKESVAAYFDSNPDLEAELRGQGRDALLAKVRRAPGLIRVEVAVQRKPLGLGHAVGCAEPLLAEDEDAVAVLLPDDFVLPTGVLGTMAAIRRRHGGSVLCAFDVPRERISAYGVFEVEDTDDPDVRRVRGMVEKPAPEAAPSTLAAAGRYLLDRAVFDALRRIVPGAGGELQLTDAVALLIDEDHPVHVVVHHGERHDLGTPAGLLRASVDFALADSDVGPELRRWLRDRVERETT